MDSFQEKEVGKGCERVKIIIIFPFRSYPTRNKKFQNNSKKIKKIKKIPLQVHFKPIQAGTGREKQKMKVIDPFRSYPALNRKLKKQLKNSKN